MSHLEFTLFQKVQVYFGLCAALWKTRKEDPWVVAPTGDYVGTSRRGAFVTVLCTKLADRRLVQQELTGKTENQSRDMYTPSVAGFVDEAELMPYYHRLKTCDLRFVDRFIFCFRYNSDIARHRCTSSKRVSYETQVTCLKAMTKLNLCHITSVTLSPGIVLS